MLFFSEVGEILPSDFGLQFVGRLVGEHIDAGSLALKEVTDDIGRNRDGGLEIGR